MPIIFINVKHNIIITMVNFTDLNETVDGLFGVLGTLISGFVDLLINNIVELAIVGAILAAIIGLVAIVVSYIKKTMNSSMPSTKMK